MAIFTIDSEKISQEKTIYSSSFNDNIKLKPEYQSELSKLVKYDKNLQEDQFYYVFGNKIYYYSKYDDNFIKTELDSLAISQLAKKLIPVRFDKVDLAYLPNYRGIFNA